jgi:hypothetical protein
VTSAVFASAWIVQSAKLGLFECLGLAVKQPMTLVNGKQLLLVLI